MDLFLASSLLCLLFDTGMAAVDKKLIPHIQCEVCELSMEHVGEHVEENKVKDTDAIADVVDQMCSYKKQEGRWVAKYDITRTGDGPLSLEAMDTLSHCKSECTVIQRACMANLKGKEDVLVPLLEARRPAYELKEKMCKKICDKKLPKLTEFTDIPFVARDTKELEAEERVAKMEAETGQKFQMWSKEQIAGMSQADIELEAAKDALGAQRRQAKMEKEHGQEM
mmetsp:Transcript_111201/g.314749  ORF Transcript_111201/g.314749 Transcript_111201/m.314749 type:complete len:225 (-) Transcript_111201:287-961(-)